MQQAPPPKAPSGRELSAACRLTEGARASSTYAHLRGSPRIILSHTYTRSNRPAGVVLLPGFVFVGLAWGSSFSILRKKQRGPEGAVELSLGTTAPSGLPPVPQS